MKPFVPTRNTHGWRACVALLDGDMQSTELGAAIGRCSQYLPAALRHVVRNEVIRSYRDHAGRLCFGLTPGGRERISAAAADVPADDVVPDMPVLQSRVCALGAMPLPVRRDQISQAWWPITGASSCCHSHP